MNLRLIPAALIVIVLTLLGLFLSDPSDKPPPVSAKKDVLAEGSLLQKISWEPAAEWKLPKQLKEVSGATLYQKNRLLAHNDEKAIIYELLEDGEVSELVRNGKPAQLGDFEGLAAVGEILLLLASDGRMLRFDMDLASVEEIDTGLGDVCELEGLEYDAQDDMLVYVCKQQHDNSPEIRLYRSAVDGDAPALWMSLPFADLPGGLNQFYPSSIVLTDTVLLASARQEALLEITREGKPLSVVHLKNKRHPQTEAMYYLEEGVLVLMDEGKKKGQLIRYISQ